MRSNLASDNVANVLWTAPSMILCGQFMQSKIGHVKMGKFTGLAVVMVMAFQTAFAPDGSGCFRNWRPLSLVMPRIDCQGEGYYMGADGLASASVYFTLFYLRLWNPAFVMMALHGLNQGPQGMGGPLAGLIAAMTLL